MTKKTHTTNTIKFIPTIKDWEGLYSNWFKRLVNALWKSGRVETVEDAVQDAFLKVTGFSGNRELQDAPEPKTEMEWYGFLKRQAEWILGQEREKNLKWKAEVSTVEELLRKIESVRQDGELSRSQRELSLRRHRQLMQHLVDIEGREAEVALPSDGLDEIHCRDVVRRLIADVCRASGISDRNRDAFILYVLDEVSPSEVVSRVWGEPSSLQEAAERKNNLYVIKNRVIRRLRDFADNWQGGGHSADEFLAAA